MSLSYCPECLKKQQRINELEEEVVQLKARLRYQERSAAEGPFGSSTPSSKVPFKPEALPERQARVGGATAGHPGQGRVALAPEEADRVERLSAPSHCPGCGEVLHTHQWRSRTVLDLPPVAVQRVVHVLEVKRCPRCGRTVRAGAARRLACPARTRKPERIRARVAGSGTKIGVPSVMIPPLSVRLT